MPDFSTERLRRQQDVRVHWQPGGAGPQNATYLLGSEDAQIGFITDMTIVNNGDVEPFWVPSPTRPGRWELRGRNRSAPDLPTVSLEWYENLNGAIPAQLKQQRCNVTFYELSGRCKSLADINRGWTGYVLVYADGIAGAVNGGARSARTDDNPLMDTIEYSLRDAYPAGQLSFSDEATTEVVQEVIDGVFYAQQSCADCGAENDGSRFAYFVTRANVGSPSAAGQLVYTTNYGFTWQTATITGIGATNQPTLIDIQGSRLFVVNGAGLNLFYTTIDDNTGTIGAWTTVSSVGNLLDVWVASSRAVWAVTSGGAIRLTRDVATGFVTVDTGATQLNRVHGNTTTIVAVGDTGVVRASKDNGASWATYPVVVGGSTITTNFVGVWVWDSQRWFVLSSANVLYYTNNAGTTWGTVATPNSGTGTGRDIVFATPEIAYLSYDISSTAYLAASLDGGRSWANDGARLVNLITAEKFGRIAVPTSGTADVDSNTLALCGLRATAGGDGVISIGVATKQ